MEDDLAGGPLCGIDSEGALAVVSVLSGVVIVLLSFVIAHDASQERAPEGVLVVDDVANPPPSAGPGIGKAVRGRVVVDARVLNSHGKKDISFATRLSELYRLEPVPGLQLYRITEAS